MTMIATYPKPDPAHAMACQCEECKQFVDGLREQCAHCKQLFRPDEVFYRQDDIGYNALCIECIQLPVFLSFVERLRHGLVPSEEIRNWNAFHDM